MMHPAGVLSPTSSRLFVALIAALLAMGTLLGGAAQVDAKRPDGPRVDFELTILHNNDGESKLSPVFAGNDPTKPYAGVAYFASLVDLLKREATSGPPLRPGSKRGVVMLSSGDNFLAGAEWAASLEKGVPFYDSIAMSLIGYDAAAIGNHEFDFGPDTLADFIRGFWPPLAFLSANMDVSAEPALAELEAEGRIAKSTVVEERGELIGVIGATTPQLPNISSPRNVVVGDVLPAVQAEVDRLEGMGIDKIILISHLQDINEELDLAPMLRGIDVMIAGGGDELLRNDWNPLSPGDSPDQIFGEYPLIATDADGNQLPVITTPGDYKYVGRLTVGFDKGGNVVLVDEASSGPVRVIGFDDGTAPTSAWSPDYVVEPHPEVQAQVVKPVQAFVAELANNILATSAVALEGRRPMIRQQETNLGNLTADSMLWQGQQTAPSFGVDAPEVAFQNSGGIRNNSLIPAGPISELNTFQILAFTNFVSVMEDITAEHLKEVLETSVSDVGGGNGRFGHWAGLTFEYDPARQAREIDGETCAVGAEGDRVQTITVGTETIYENGVWRVDANTWTTDIATNDFTFRGGDCYDFRRLPFTTLGVTYQQALANFLVDGLGGVISAADYPENWATAPQRVIPI